MQLNTESGVGLELIGVKGAGQVKSGIYILSVIPGLSADKDGRLSTGDQLLSIDEHSLLGLTMEEAFKIFRRNGSVVTLVVAKGAAFNHGLDRHRSEFLVDSVT